MRGLMALGGILLMVAMAPAQRLPLPPDEQTAVNRAIDRGVSYLKRAQQKNGTWANPRNNWQQAKFHKHVYAVGFTALPGLTLLECGVPASDPIILQAARFVRSQAAKLDQTYELSVAILFLDRLGDPADKKLIQTFALRLIAGQSATGGWSYKCPLLGDKLQKELLLALRRLDPPAEEMPALVRRGGKNPAELPPIARAGDAGVLQDAIVRSAAPSLSDSIRRSPGESPSLSEDISRGSPGESLSEEDALDGPPERRRDCLGLTFLEKQNLQEAESKPKPPPVPKQPRNKSDGIADKGKSSDPKAAQNKPSQTYIIPARIKRLAVVQDPEQHILQDPASDAVVPPSSRTDNSNTQFAILALWTAQRYDVPMKRSLNLIVRRYQTSQNGNGTWNYHYYLGGAAQHEGFSSPGAMNCVGLIGLAVSHGLAQPRPAGQPVQDPRIINGLIALSNTIGQPVEQAGRLPMQNLYFLWSLERVAVLYNLPTIGDKDWYRWGAQILLRNQEIEGNWAGGLYIGSCPPIDTCLALLFLKRANLVKDLTAKLPFTGDELNKGIREILEPQKPTEPVKKPKKPIPPAETPKPAELEKTIAATPTQTTLEEPAPVPESNGGKKKWIVVFVVLFLILSGASLFFILLAVNRRKNEQEEEKQDKPRKRSVSRDP